MTRTWIPDRITDTVTIFCKRKVGCFSCGAFIQLEGLTLSPYLWTQSKFMMTENWRRQETFRTARLSWNVIFIISTRKKTGQKFMGPRTVLIRRPALKTKAERWRVRLRKMLRSEVTSRLPGGTDFIYLEDIAEGPALFRFPQSLNGLRLLLWVWQSKWCLP